jgi:hypothetical protein
MGASEVTKQSVGRFLVKIGGFGKKQIAECT